jgi:hypothetical protein
VTESQKLCRPWARERYEVEGLIRQYSGDAKLFDLLPLVRWSPDRLRKLTALLADRPCDSPPSTLG